MIFQEGRKGGQQYLGLRPVLCSSLTSILLELQHGKSHGQTWSGQRATSSPAQPHKAPHFPRHFGKGRRTAPAPSFKSCRALCWSSSPLTPSWLVDIPAISVRGAPTGQVKADPALLHSLEYGPGWYSPNSEVLCAASCGFELNCPRS